MLQDTLAVVAPHPVNSWADLLLVLMPLLQAQMTVPLMEALKRMFTWVDKRAGWQKQLLVLGINAIFSLIAVLLGVKIDGASDVTTASVGALIGSALSMAAHAAKTAKAVKQQLPTPSA